MEVKEFVTKIRMSLHLGLRPVFAVRSLPRTWAEALIHAGGYAMIMQYQFYPWTHTQLASEIREKLLLPVDTPRKIEDGTMQRFENWTANPDAYKAETGRVERFLAKIEEAPLRHHPM
jgi:hypothetical protein